MSKQTEYSRENVTPLMCLEFWEKELTLVLAKEPTIIVYSDAINKEDYINRKLIECQAHL